MEQKSAVRRHFRALIQEVPGKNILNQGLNAELHRFLEHHSGVWGSFRALADEPEIADSLKQEGQLQWVYPRCEDKDLRYYAVASDEDWELGPYGLKQPQSAVERWIPPQEIAGLLIPGVAFDRKGARLGRGQAYFDRFLASYSGLKVGIAWSFQISEESLPCEGHDVQMDYIVTDQGALGPFDR